MKMKIFKQIFVPLLKNKPGKNDLSLFFFQDIHLSDFSEKHPKNADLFF